MKCETCGDREGTYFYDNDVDLLDVNDSYTCEECSSYITLEYCRGHDMYYEWDCPNCEELKD